MLVEVAVLPPAEDALPPKFRLPAGPPTSVCPPQAVNMLKTMPVANNLAMAHYTRFGSQHVQASEVVANASLYHSVYYTAGLRRSPTGTHTRLTRRIDFHSGRRKFVQALADIGLNAQQAQKLAGHSDLASHERYLHSTSKTLTIAAGALPDLRLVAASYDSSGISHTIKHLSRQAPVAQRTEQRFPKPAGVVPGRRIQFQNGLCWWPARQVATPKNNVK